MFSILYIVHRSTTICRSWWHFQFCLVDYKFHMDKLTRLRLFILHWYPKYLFVGRFQTKILLRGGNMGVQHVWCFCKELLPKFFWKWFWGDRISMRWRLPPASKNPYHHLYVRIFTAIENIGLGRNMWHEIQPLYTTKMLVIWWKLHFLSTLVSLHVAEINTPPQNNSSHRIRRCKQRV